MTVASLMNSCAAASRLVEPPGDQLQDLQLALRSAVPRPGARTWPMQPGRDRGREHRLAARGRRAPRGTARRAARPSAGSRWRRPRSRAARRCRCRTWSAPAPGPATPRCASSLIAVTPSIRGIRRSISTTSGSQRLDRRRPPPRRRRPRRAPRSRGSPANMPAQPVPDHRVVVDDEQPDRRAVSLRRRNRAGDAIGRDRGAAARLRLDLQRAREAVHPLAHRGRARSRRPSDRWHACAPGSKPDAVVPHVQRHQVLHVGQGQPDPGRPRRAWPRWPAPPARSAAASPRSPGASAGPCRWWSAPRSTPLTLRPRRRPPRRAPPAAGRSASGSGSQRVHRPAGLGEALPGQVPALSGAAASRPAVRACSAASSWVTMPVRPWARVSWISRAIRCRSSRTPGLARLDEQLGVQAGVLLHRRLELAVGLGQLVDDRSAARAALVGPAERS